MPDLPTAATFSTEKPWSTVQVSADGGWLAAGSKSGHLSIWDLEERARLVRLEMPLSPYEGLSIAVSRAKKLAAAIHESENTIRGVNVDGAASAIAWETKVDSPLLVRIDDSTGNVIVGRVGAMTVLDGKTGKLVEESTELVDRFSAPGGAAEADVAPVGESGEYRVRKKRAKKAAIIAMAGRPPVHPIFEEDGEWCAMAETTHLRRVNLISGETSWATESPSGWHWVSIGCDFAAKRYVALLTHKRRGLRIVEIDGATGNFTATLADQIPRCYGTFIPGTARLIDTAGRVWECAATRADARTLLVEHDDAGDVVDL
jgi:hypothetical protein